MCEPKAHNTVCMSAECPRHFSARQSDRNARRRRRCTTLDSSLRQTKSSHLRQLAFLALQTLVSVPDASTRRLQTPAALAHSFFLDDSHDAPSSPRAPSTRSRCACTRSTCLTPSRTTRSFTTRSTCHHATNLPLAIPPDRAVVVDRAVDDCAPIHDRAIVVDRAVVVDPAAAAVDGDRAGALLIVPSLLIVPPSSMSILPELSIVPSLSIVP